MDLEEDQQNVLFNAWLAARATVDLLDRELAPSGITADDFAIYSVLTVAPSMTPSELAAWMAAPASSVTSYIKRFEARGHVERVPNPKDRRSYSIALTPAGHTVHQQAGALFNPALARVTEILGKRTRPVQAALMELRSALDSSRQTAPVR